VSAIAALGPSFVKLGQVFSSRSDLLPEPYVSVISTLTDQVPPVPTPIIEHEIERAFGRPVRDIFEQFDTEPLAAASLGQVHRARYRGEEVVIKVLRPGVEELVRKDMALARPVLAWLERRVPNPHIHNARIVIEEFAARVPEEMDFVHEAENARRIHENFRGNPRVVIPRVIEGLVRQRVLVLEYIEGTRVDRLSSRHGERPQDPRGIVSAVMELYLRMMLVDGFFHADPHPGNVLVTPDGKVVVLDFGMVIPVTRELRWRLVTTIFAAIRRDAEGLVAGFESIGMIDPGADPVQVRGLADRLLTLAYVEMPMRERVELVTNEVMAALYDWPVRLPSEMVYFARTSALIEGLGVRYDENFNAITFASPIALKMRREIMASLGQVSLPPEDMATVVGAAIGHAAGTALRAGRKFMKQLGVAFSREEPPERRALPPPPTLLAGD
jgi:predicted unusual protein kinase regulating ubiquinone biosynthesis (AarF/ABC1/UbiB family)